MTTHQPATPASLTAPPSTGAAARGAVRWVALGWDHPAAAELRGLMDAEIRPRYAGRGPRPYLPPPPTAEQVAVTWVAFPAGDMAHESPETTAASSAADGAAGGLGIPLATASLRLLPGDLYEVKRVFVRPDHRGRGLAAAALAAVESSAAGLGARSLVLQTGNRQPEAVALYQREGWRRIAPYPPYTRDPYSLCFTKSIAVDGG